MPSVCRLKTSAVLLALLLTACPISRAQVRSAGIFNSLKGFGLSFELPSADENTFTSFNVFADIYGLVTSRTDVPGVRAGADRCRIFSRLSGKDVNFLFYAGTGLCLGYVHDYETGTYNGRKDVLVNNMGFVAALDGRVGCRFLFNRRITIDAAFSADLGVHVRKDENSRNALVRLYKNGIFQLIYPEVKLEYHF